MKPKRPSIPLQVEAFHRPQRWRAWLWGRLAGLVSVLLLIWLMSQSPDESTQQSPATTGTAQLDGPPWQMGNPQAHFTLTLYADLECPFCKEYFPLLKRWVASNDDITLQWHHQPLAAHEPVASAEARLAECAAESGGHAAFWKAIEWIYDHTRSDGQGVPDDLRYPALTPAIEQCMKSGRPDSIIHAQAEEATKGGVTATPSLRLHNRQTGQAILLQGPIEGDALLSAMDMLAAEDSTFAPSSEMPADVIGDMPR